MGGWMGFVLALFAAGRTVSYTVDRFSAAWWAMEAIQFVALTVGGMLLLRRFHKLEIRVEQLEARLKEIRATVREALNLDAGWKVWRKAS